MSDILCVYYSRTGRTEKAMGEIARALDAELVKIEPKSIGVGQYQHDMPEVRLEEVLCGVVEN